MISRGPRSRRRARLWLQWSLVALLLAGCALIVDLGEVTAVVTQASLAGFLLAVALVAVDRFLMAWKWSILLRAHEVSVPVTSLLNYYLQATAAAVFLPSSLAGDLWRGYWVGRSGAKPAHGYASILMEKVVGLVCAVNWTLIGGTTLAIVSRPSHAPVWAGAAMVGALAANGAVLLCLRPGLHAPILRLLRSVEHRPVGGFLHRLYEAFTEYGYRQAYVFRHGLLTFLEQGLQILITLVLALSLGIRPPLIPFLGTVALYLLVYRLPVAPDGWGVGELTAIGLFGMIGVSPEEAFSLALLTHILHLVVAIPGLWLLARQFFHTRGSAPRGDFGPE